MLHRYPALSPAVVLIISLIVFGLLNDRFLSTANLSLVVQQVAVIGALAIGQTLIVLTAGIDLSVGAAMILSTLVAAGVATDHGWPGPLALLAALVIGVATGVINGVLVTRLNLPPFIVTLGTLNVFTAVALLYSDAATTRGIEMPGLLTWTGKSFDVAGAQITYGVVLMILLYISVAFALSQTSWGRHVYAVGDDAESARLSGIHVTRVILSVYVTAGALFAAAGWILMGRVNAASPNAGVDANLDSHHGSRDRRHEPLRWPRRPVGQPDRRPHRRCVPQRAQPRGTRRPLPNPRRRCARHHRGLCRPVDQEGTRMTSTATTATSTPVLQAKGLVKTFGHVVGLAGVDLELHAGEVLAIIGDNGAGKSTLIKCLSGAYVPDAGELLVEGRPVVRQPRRRPQGRHRDGLPDAGRVARARHREQPVPRVASSDCRAYVARCSGCSTRRACATAPSSRSRTSASRRCSR